MVLEKKKKTTIVTANTINLLQYQATKQQLLKVMTIIKQHYLFYCQCLIFY